MTSYQKKQTDRFTCDARNGLSKFCSLTLKTTEIWKVITFILDRNMAVRIKSMCTYLWNDYSTILFCLFIERLLDLLVPGSADQSGIAPTIK